MSDKKCFSSAKIPSFPAHIFQRAVVSWKKVSQIFSHFGIAGRDDPRQCASSIHQASQEIPPGHKRRRSHCKGEIHGSRWGVKIVHTECSKLFIKFKTLFSSKIGLQGSTKEVRRWQEGGGGIHRRIWPLLPKQKRTRRWRRRRGRALRSSGHQPHSAATQVRKKDNSARKGSVYTRCNNFSSLIWYHTLFNL